MLQLIYKKYIVCYVRETLSGNSRKYNSGYIYMEIEAKLVDVQTLACGNNLTHRIYSKLNPSQYTCDFGARSGKSLRYYILYLQVFRL